MSIEEILEAFRKQCVNKENTGNGFGNTLQALNLYIEEQIKSCIPKFSDMNVDNADQMEGFKKACLLMEANVEKRDK